MLIKVQPDVPAHSPPVSTPPWLAPLVHPTAGSTLSGAVDGVLAHLGFASMVYGAKGAGPMDERVFVWTTAPPEWVQEYDQNSYVEIDPRVRSGWDLPLPLVWDSTMRVEDARGTYFLERAARHGIGSGVAMYFFIEDYMVMLSLNRPERVLSAVERSRMEARMGDALHFGYLFHWLYMRDVIARGMRPQHHGAPLSPREHQCVHFAAHGMTSNDIAVKLGITERTANFHFSNSISKLGVLNRQEAVAKAVSLGLVKVGALGNSKQSAYFASRPAARRQRGRPKSKSPSR